MESGCRPLPEKIEATASFPRPASIKQLQEFLGTCNYYRSYVRRFAEVSLPLTGAWLVPLSHWGEREVAFNRLKLSLAETTLLHHPVSGAKLSLHTDSSAAAVGAVLQQQVHGQLQPLAFFSKKLNPAQLNYSTIHLNLVGPLSISSGYTFLLTIIDRMPRWFEVVPMKSTTTANCATTLVEHWISRYGIPKQLVSDCSVQFTSSVWAHVSAVVGFHHVTTISYHPQSNGRVERIHSSLKNSLCSHSSSADWSRNLPWVLLALRA